MYHILTKRFPAKFAAAFIKRWPCLPISRFAANFAANFNEHTRQTRADWALTLVVLAVIPFTVLGMFIEFRLYGGGQSTVAEDYAKANSVVLEALSAVRIGKVVSYVTKTSVSAFHTLAI